ncbi:MAG TPA: LysM peptidoglycan-binding domain-containing protein [Bacteroidales bacterium]|nr:LysM peptidoglycan-binding domain-containing protein [Bacteroidales bacterium]HOL97578.1 LysM peptidoglycan-binding domain-containing protein [Bacteroidales bacterium]HUM32668.1 LysM peptidoglycan-binding domain-containing protein [Bacteroidales bacterium]
MQRFLLILLNFSLLTILTSQNKAQISCVNDLKKNLKIFCKDCNEEYFSSCTENYYHKKNSSPPAYVYVGNEKFAISSQAAKIKSDLDKLRLSEKCKLKYCYFYFTKVSFFDGSIPKEIALLPIAISGLDNNFITNYKGVGVWGLQYIPAAKFDFPGDINFDNRLNPQFSSKTATRYLAHLYTIYGRWNYSIAAYLTSPIYINKIIDSTRDEDIISALQEDIIHIFDRLVALIYWFEENPITESFCLCPEKSIDTVRIVDKIHFEQIATVLNIDIAELKNLNNVFTSEIIDGKKREKILFLPTGYGQKFYELYDTICSYNTEKYFPRVLVNGTDTSKDTEIYKVPGPEYEKISYKIVSGDNLGSIAQKFGVKISEIQEWNNIDGTKIYAGQEIVLWKKKGEANQADNKITNNEVKSRTNTQKFDPSQYELVETYEVKKGDSAYKIAKKYSWATADEILEWNGISDPSKLQIGQKLKIYRKKQ